jgi:ABC-type antimicrobial peptide transport system permease subunit
MIEGRDFSDRDAAGSPRVAIVNQTFASRAFGKASALGRRLSFAKPDQFDIEIVGVVRDLRYEHLREAAPDGVFFPLGQAPSEELDTPRVAGPPLPIGLTLMVRARDGQQLARDELRQQVLAFDARLLVDRIWTFDDEAGRALSQERLLAGFGTALGGVALLLLIIGLYGTLTAAVARSRRELGIRLALGAAPRSLSAMVVGRSLVVVAVGLALGLPLSYVATKYFSHMLYGVSPAEPLVAAAIVLTLLATAAVSAYLPARQAANVDPVVALRAD